MSKIEAYKCDACGLICTADETNGLSMTQDMFDEFKSYPLTPTPDKADIHFCLECYRLRVINFLPSEKERRANEYDYQVKKDNLTLAFKKSIVYAFNHNKTAALRKGK
jgi:hypothetical protein